jgi:pimeloyl-ACP methyl ester carboxylesterase
MVRSLATLLCAAATLIVENTMLRHIQAFLLLWVGVSASGQSKDALGPAPGTLLDVFGHKLHIHCIGPDKASPVVIFEAGAGAFSKDWVAVQGLLEKQIRSCAYDRAGLGWSEPGPGPRTLQQEVLELHALLQAAHVSGPLVLVGQSLGALNVRLYTQKYGTDVAGVVLVDPADESSLLYSVTSKRWMKLREQARGRAVPPPRTSGPPSTGYKPEDDYLGEEAQLLYFEREKRPTPFDDRPLFVLAAGRRPPPPGMTEETYRDIRRVIDEDRAEAVHLSKNAKFLVDAGSGHDIQLDDPKAVASAVAEVVEAVKHHTSLAN